MSSVDQPGFIAAENNLGEARGVVDRDVWFVSAEDSDPDLSGFADPLSVDRGQPAESIRLKIRSTNAFTVDVFRLGWYGGKGARRVARLAGGRPFPSACGRQPLARWEGAHSTVDCGNWRTSAVYLPTQDVPSGVFVAKVMTSTGRHRGKGRLIPFVIRDDSRRSAVLFQLPDVTWQAYNLWTDDPAHSSIVPGVRANGAFYSPDAAGGVTVRASYRRPFSGSAARLPDGGSYDTTCGFTLFWETAYLAVRWLERIGVDVCYTTGQAVAADAFDLLPDKRFPRLFMTAGHDEYWSQEQRDKVERARRAGMHFAFLSGNDMFWRVRWDGPGTIVCAKESNAPPRPDTCLGCHTGLWADARCGTVWAENATTGSRSAGQGASRELLVSPSQARHRFWRNTAFELCGTRALDADRARHRSVGHEWNHDEDNGWRPPGLVHLSSTPMAGTSLTRGDGDSARGRSPSVHHLTLFRDPSTGSLVFHAGSIDFARVVDGFRLTGTAPSVNDPMMRSVQQALVNLFADMGLPRPATLPEGVSWTPGRPPSPAPVVSIEQPRTGIHGVAAPLAVRGTARAANGSHVAGVEVSMDGGRWRPAIGGERWHAWISPPSAGIRRLRARAVDDWGNIGEEDVVEVDPPSPRPPARVGRAVWGHPFEPLVDRSEVETEAGCAWRPRTDGEVEGVALWHPPGDRGPRYANLWQILDGEGTRLASAVVDEDGFQQEGWREARFGVPIEVTAGCRYVVSVRSPGGLPFSVEPPAAPLMDDIEGRCSQWVRDESGLCRFSDGRLARDRPPAPAQDGRYPLVEPLFVATVSRRHTLWPESGAEPTFAHVELGQPAEVGVRFSADVPGSVTAVRFFNDAPGAATVNLWDERGCRVATARAVSGQTDSDGWHEVPFGRHVPVSAGVRWVASYTAAQGIVALSDDYYACDEDDPVRTLVLRAYGGVVGPAGRFPWNIEGRWRRAITDRLNPCYFVDVVFQTGS